MRGIAFVQLFLLCFALLLQGQSNRTISDVYVNLPATCAECRKVRYELTAYNGCYSWLTTNPQIIALEPVGDEGGCSSRAALTAVVSRPIKTVVIVRATDAVTRETLISQVKVSRLAEIRILTNFKAIDVEDVQKLYIQAFDDSNNVISSVEGLRFEWKIETNQHALKMITSKEANYENTPARLAMENKRFQTDLILVRGVQTGIVEVSARILEKDYEVVKKARISLFVIEPFFLIPDKPVYLLTHSEFTYKIAKGKRQAKGRAGLPSTFNEVPLPSKQYHFYPDDAKLLKTADTGVVYTQDTPGEVLVRVEDTTLTNNTVEGLIYVVEPEAVELSIRDVTALVDNKAALDALVHQVDMCERSIEDAPGLNNWNLVVNHVYLVTSCVTDASKNFISLTSNIAFDLVYQESVFKYLTGNAQRSAIVFKAIEPSLKPAKIRSVLAIQNQKKYSAFAEKDARVFPQVQISHPTPTVLLPYLARTRLQKLGPEPQMWTLEALGGSGAYKWEAESNAIAAMTSQGVVYGLKLGTTKAVVYDALNRLNNATIDVEVERVDRILWLEGKMELQTDTKEVMSAIALDFRGRKFTNCSSVPLAWAIKDETIVRLRDGENYSSYDLLKHYAHNEGKELIKLRHGYDVSGPAGDPLSATFDERVQLHNMFGICGQRQVSTLREGMARVSATFAIVEEDGLPYKRESEYSHVSVYKSLRTLNPTYEDFLRNLKKDEKDESHKRFVQQLKSENEFILGFGSGLSWEVSGGTSSWVDTPSHYFEDVKIERITGGEDVKLAVQKMGGGDSVRTVRPVHYLECSVPPDRYFAAPQSNEFKLTLTTGNKRSRSLLRPAINALAIEISCQLPQTMQLIWAQKMVDKNVVKYEVLPKRESEADVEPDTYFVKTGQLLNIRALAFDKFRRLIYNFSSYGLQTISSNPALGVVTGIDPYYMHTLETTHEAGTFLVRGNLVGVFGDESRKVVNLDKVWDSMRINLVNILKVEPEYKLLYLDERNKLTLKFFHGSGNFAVKTNASGIVDIQYSSKDSPRTAIVTPLNPGYVEVIVEDIGVSSSASASCVILVSDIDRIELKQDLILEQGAGADVWLTYFGTNGEEYPADQYRFINVQLFQDRKRPGNGGSHAVEESNKGLDIFRSNELEYNRYTIKARELGGYEVSATARRKARDAKVPEVVSNLIYIEVFPQLQIWPRKLLLLPDGSYTLKLSGGPSLIAADLKAAERFGGSIARQFRSNDTNVAVVNPRNGEVTGMLVGVTNVYVVITQEVRDRDGSTKYVELCRRGVPVSVQLATDVEIVGGQKRPLISGSIIRLLGVLKYFNETFTFGVFPVEYWWTSRHFHVLSMHPLHSSGAMRYGGETNVVASSIQGDQLGVDAKANRAGEAEVAVFTTITYPEIYRHNVHEFNVSVVIRVVNPLYGNVPTFIDSPAVHTSTYLVPPRCRCQLPTNKENNMKLTYRLLCTGSTRQSQVATLIEENVLKTADHFGAATVVVEESTLVDPLRSAYYVEVAPIHSLVVEHGTQIIAMPLGADVVLKLVYQDKFGRSFAPGIEGIETSIDISHPRVLRADLDYYNSTLTVRALELGSSNIHVFLSGKEYVFDLIRVHVTSIIEPISPVFVHVGGTVQFRTSYNYSTSTEQSIWGSEDVSILEVNPVTGLGKAKNEGTTNVHINDTIHLTTSVTCGRVKYISLDLSSSPKLLTNIDSHRQYKPYYRLQFRIYPDDTNIDITPDPARRESLISHNIHFECKSLNPTWILAKTEEEETKGRVKSAVCLLFPRPGSMNENTPSTIAIEVSAGSKEFAYMKSETFTFPFISAFSLLSSKELVFTRTNRSRVVKLAGSTDLKVNVEDPTLCDIRVMPSESDNLSELQVTIPRDVTHTFTNLRLHVENPLTGQREDLLVSYFHDVSESERQHVVIDTTPGTGSSWPVADILTVLILIISCVVVVKCILWNTGPAGDRQRYQQPGGLRAQNLGYRTPGMGPAPGRMQPYAGNPMRTPADRMARPGDSTDVMKNVAYKSSGFKQ